MSRRNWSIIAAFVGLIAVYWLVDDLASVSRQIQSEATDRAYGYGKDADSYIERRCEVLATTAWEDCTRQADQSARENQRVEMDLAAQRVTAWWTQVMGVAALIGMALSAVGVWLVYTTFRETRRSADAASDNLAAFVAVEHARLTIGVADITTFANGIRAELKAWNIGKTSCILNFVGFLPFKVAQWPELGFPGNGRDTPIKADSGSEIVSHFEKEWLKVPYYLIGCVVYASPFQANHRTNFCVEVTPPLTGRKDYQARLIRADGQPDDT